MRAARWLGILVQSLVLGLLLFLAVLNLVIARSDDTIFRYQGF